MTAIGGGISSVGLPRAVRFPARLPALARWAGGEGEGVTRNLTLQGACVCLRRVAGESPKRGDAVDVTLTEGTAAIELRGTVAWVDVEARDHRGARSTFVGLSLTALPGSAPHYESSVGALRLSVLAVVQNATAAISLQRALGAHYALQLAKDTHEALTLVDAHEFGVVIAQAPATIEALAARFPNDLSVKLLWSDAPPPKALRPQLFLTLPTATAHHTLRASVDGAIQHYWARAEPTLYFYWAQHEAVGGHQPTAVEQRGAALRRLLPFEGLGEEAIDMLSRAVTLQRARAGQKIFSAGDPGDALYVLVSGEARVIHAGTETARIGAGAVLGEGALLLGEPRSATVEVSVDTELYRLSKSDFDSLLVKHPATAVALCRELARRTASPPRETTQAPLRQVAVVGHRWGAELAWALERLGLQVALVCVDGRLPTGLAHRPAVIEEPAHVSEARLQRRLTELGSIFDRVVLAVPHEASTVARRAAAKADAVIAFDAIPPELKAHARRVVESVRDPLKVERIARRIACRTVGLVLSSGGAWGIAHIGVLKVLQDERVPVDLVTGASAGAIVGAGFCAGWPPDQMYRFAREELMERLSVRGGLVDPALNPRAGFLKGQRTRDWLAEVFQERVFADLGTPLHVVCSDVSSGCEHVLSRGPVADAVRASIGIPGVFVPWQVEGRYLVDGGMVNPLPLSTARDHGADLIIASTVTSAAANRAGPRLDTKAPSYMNQLVNLMSALERESLKLRESWADVMIKPDVGRFKLIDYAHADELMALGVAAARAQLEQIRAVKARAVIAR